MISDESNLLNYFLGNAKWPKPVPRELRNSSVPMGACREISNDSQLRSQFIS